MGKRGRNNITKRNKDEDTAPTEEELKFYPKLGQKSENDVGWEDAFDDEDIFGDGDFEGFMGLEVFHGSLKDLQEANANKGKKQESPKEEEEEIPLESDSDSSVEEDDALLMEEEVVPASKDKSTKEEDKTPVVDNKASTEDMELLNDEKEKVVEKKETKKKEAKPVDIDSILHSDNGIEYHDNGLYYCTLCKRNINSKKQVAKHIASFLHKKNRKQHLSETSSDISKEQSKSNKKQIELKSEIDAISGTEEATLLYGTKSWSDYNLHPTLLKNLKNMKCTKPTLIQEKGIETALRGKDVLGAAPTGSGKTLAFAIPVINWLLQNQHDDDSDEEKKKKKWTISCMIITPTRELALQTMRVLTRLCESTSIKTVGLIGGLAIPKQQRLLKKCPQIVVGTPGRLWYFMEEHVITSSTLNHIRFVIADEADKLITPGAYPEMTSIISSLASARVISSDINFKPQTLFYSATLSLQEGSQNAKQIRKYMNQLACRGNPEIVATGDQAKKVETKSNQLLPQGLILRSVHVAGDKEKEEFLYYFGKQYSGVLKRVYNILSNLGITVFRIYSGMQQKQRIKNLSTFQKENNSMLLATDVAARGLDLPNIESVLHYHLPPTSTIFVHRSGRTARGGNRGLSLCLVSSKEKQLYMTICNQLQMAQGLQGFPLGLSVNPLIRECVNKARQIAEIVNKTNQVDRDAIWAKKMLDGADMKDEHEEEEEEKVKLTNAEKKTIRSMKYELEQLLKTPISGVTYSGSYITSNPKMLEMLRRGNMFDMKRSPLDEIEDDTESKPKRRRKH